MIKLSYVIETDAQGASRSFVKNESVNATPQELQLLKAELEAGDIKDPLNLKIEAVNMLKPATGSFKASPAGAFAGSAAGNRKA